MDDQLYVVTCDLEYKVTSINGVAEVVFGLPVDQLLGKPMADVICAKEFSSAAWGIFLQVRNKQLEWEGEMLARRADDTLFHSSVKISPIEDGRGVVIGLLATGQDLSEADVEASSRTQFAQYLVGECNLTPTTAFTYEQGLLRLEKFLRKDAAELTSDDLRLFIRESDYHPSTKSSTLQAMKAFHKWGALEGMWTLNGIAAMRGPKIVRDPKPELSKDVARRVIEMCRRPNEYRLVYLGLYGGLRITESASIGSKEWLEDRLRFVGKGRKTRDVPLHPELAAKKDVILSSTASRGTLKHTCASLSHYAGTHFTSHALRRTAAVSMSEAGASRDVIGAILGHAPLSVTTSSYVPVRWQERVEAISLLNYE